MADYINKYLQLHVFFSCTNKFYTSTVAIGLPWSTPIMVFELKLIQISYTVYVDNNNEEPSLKWQADIKQTR